MSPPFNAFFVFDTAGAYCSAAPINEAQTQDAKLIYSWPNDNAEHYRDRMGVIEALLDVSSDFLPPPGTSGPPPATHRNARMLTIQTHNAVAVADCLPDTQLLVALVCDTPHLRSGACTSPTAVDAWESSTSSTDASLASRFVHRFETSVKPDVADAVLNGATKRKPVETPTTQQQLPFSPSVSLESDVALASAVLTRFTSHFLLFHNLNDLSLTPTSSRFTGGVSKTTSRPSLSDVLHQFVPRFLFVEAGTYGKAHTQMLAGESGIQYGCLSRAGFLHVRSFLHQFMLSRLFREDPSVSLSFTALFQKGYFIGGNMPTEDLAVLHDYLVSSPSGKVSNDKLLTPPWSSHTIAPAHCQLQSFYGLSHRPATIFSSSRPDVKAAPSHTHNKKGTFLAEGLALQGYLYGPGPFHGPLHQWHMDTLSATKDVLPDHHEQRHILFIPRIHLPSKRSVYLVVFVYNDLMLAMLFDTLPHVDAPCSEQTDKQRFFDIGILKSCPLLEHWFSKVTQVLVRKSCSLPLLSKKLQLSRMASRSLQKTETYRFFYVNYTHRALRLSDSKPKFQASFWKHSTPSWTRFLMPHASFFTTFVHRKAKVQDAKLYEGTPSVTCNEAHWVSKLHALLQQPHNGGLSCVAIKPSDCGWIIARSSLGRKYVLLTDDTQNAQLTDLLGSLMTFQRRNVVHPAVALTVFMM